MLRNRSAKGQAMVELALVAPLFFMVLFGIIVLGIGVFYQQQLTNAARAAARYAVVNTASSEQCPVVSNRTPGSAVTSSVEVYFACDTPAARWPRMTAYAREQTFGLTRSAVHVSACWSGYWTQTTSGGWGDWDQLPRDPAPPYNANPFRECTIGGIDPRTSPESLTCPGPMTTVADDMASSWSASSSGNANRVTVYACYVWNPPLAGFLLIPQQINLRSVITEGLQYQQ
jgi:hypothetical protein